MVEVQFDRSLTGTITPVQSGLENNSNEGILYIPQSSTMGPSLSDVD